MEHQLLSTLGIVFTLGMIAQWFAWKFRFPVIVLFTAFGILAGPVFGIIDPKSAFGPMLHPMVELAVAMILFEGGLLLKFHEFEKTAKGMVRLFSLAVLLNWGIGSAVGYYIGGLSLSTAMLIAGILIVTGPTVIIPALREAKLKPSTASYLKWEGIINDPFGAIFAVLIYEFIIFSGAGSGVEFIVISLSKIILVSIVLSFATRFVILWLSKHALVPEFLKVPFVMSWIFILFIASEHLQKGAGLLTITLFGLLLGNSKYSSLRDVKRFGENISVFTVAIIFIMLSASLELSVWLELDWRHFTFIGLMSFVVRPVAILLSTFKSGMRFKERILIGLYGPRGIVAASVAGAVGTGLYEIGYKEGRFVLPIIFSVILLTVIVHSFWLNWLAIKLDLKSHGEDGVLILGASPWSIQLAEKLKQLQVPVLVSDTSWYKLAPARMAGLEVHFGALMDDLEYGEPDTSEINYLIAATEDDYYNSLVCHKLRHTFGTDHVYQIPIHEDEFSQQHSLTRKDYCALDDSTEALYENMMKKYHNGWNFHSTELKEAYTIEQFKSDNPPENTVPFCILRANGRVEVVGKKKGIPAKVGDTLIYYSDLT